MEAMNAAHEVMHDICHMLLLKSKIHIPSETYLLQHMHKFVRYISGSLFSGQIDGTRILIECYDICEYRIGFRFEFPYVDGISYMR